jgi:4-alpha-glucanotransferase
VRLIGDVPHFVDGGGADVWVHPELFQLDPTGRPLRVSGTRPDVFQPEGQRWGHPLYRWEAHRKEGFAWWQRRCARVLALHDALRLDHFPGFVRTWSLPGSDSSDAEGRFEPGPGRELFDALRPTAASHCMVAEDLGDVDDDTESLRAELGIRGMTLLCHDFASLGEAQGSESCILQESVVYTSNHDTNTALGELDALTDDARAKARAALGLREGDSPAFSLVELALDSTADTAILAAQDLLGLSSAARMNRPGTAWGNWAWRAPVGAFDAELAARLRALTQSAGRTPE